MSEHDCDDPTCRYCRHNREYVNTRQHIADLIAFHRQEYEKVTAPLFKILAEIDAARGPAPMIVSRDVWEQVMKDGNS